MDNMYRFGDTDYIDRYEHRELEPSWTEQLDLVGRQPHSREYLEYQMNNIRSHRKFEKLEHSYIDHPEGIHFGDTP